MKRKFSTNLLISIIALVGLPITVYLATSKVGTYTSLKQHAAAPTISPLLFGTNLGLFNSGDSFFSPQVQSLVKQMHIQLIRFPIRNYTPNSIELQAAQIIKNLGITPLVTLSIHAPDPIAAGKVTIQDMNQIFGNSLVYYEYGNESDLSGFNDPVKYTNSWNQVISQLKSLPTNGQFGGPVNFQRNPSYIAYFRHNATPQPDFISWHEYTGHANTTIDQFLAGIARWGVHITDTKSAIQANGDSVPPIFITEWNYDANPPIPDPRDTPQFQMQFVQAALNEFAKDGITAAVQYDLNTMPDYNLIDTNNNSLTPAGQAFQQTYEQLMVTSGGVVNTNGFPAQGSLTITQTPLNMQRTVTPTRIPTQTQTSIPTQTSTPTVTPKPPTNPAGISTTGNVICSTQSNNACGYTSQCFTQGVTCEYGCFNGGSNIYTCQNGKWQFSGWTNKQQCGLCGNNSNNTSTNNTPSNSTQLCSSSTNKSCGYTSACSQNGQTCLLKDICSDGQPLDKKYVCQNGVWTYQTDVTDTCHFSCN